MIDIHSHILPGIDDGARDLDESIRMARIAVEDGITTVIATPHFHEGRYQCEAELVRQKVELVNTELARQHIPLTVVVGMEPHIRPDFLAAVKQGHLLTLNQSGKYVFLELPFDHVPPILERMVFELSMEGYVPIIPHPERTVPFHKRPQQVYELVKNGAVLQITAGSLTGLFGDQVRRFTKDLIDYRLAHLLASDAHDDRKRAPILRPAYQEVERIAGSHVADWMKYNAEAVAAGEDFYLEEPVRPRKKKKFWIFG